MILLCVSFMLVPTGVNAQDGLRAPNVSKHGGAHQMGRLDHLQQGHRKAWGMGLNYGGYGGFDGMGGNPHVVNRSYYHARPFLHSG